MPTSSYASCSVQSGAWTCDAVGNIEIEVARAVQVVVDTDEVAIRLIGATPRLDGLARGLPYGLSGEAAEFIEGVGQGGGADQTAQFPACRRNSQLLMAPVGVVRRVRRPNSSYSYVRSGY